MENQGYISTLGDKPIFSLILTDTGKVFPPQYKHTAAKCPPLCTLRAWQQGEGVDGREAAAGSALLTQHRERVRRDGPLAERSTPCFRARGIAANSRQNLSTARQPWSTLPALAGLSPFPWERAKMNPIRNPLGLFFLPAFSEQCQLSQFAVTVIYFSSTIQSHLCTE